MPTCTFFCNSTSLQLAFCAALQGGPAQENNIQRGCTGALRGLEGDPGPHLVVAPASLLENWERELARWGPGLAVQPYFGANRAETRHTLRAWR